MAVIWLNVIFGVNRNGRQQSSLLDRGLWPSKYRVNKTRSQGLLLPPTNPRHIHYIALKYLVRITALQILITGTNNVIKLVRFADFVLWADFLSGLTEGICAPYYILYHCVVIVGDILHCHFLNDPPPPTKSLLLFSLLYCSSRHRCRATTRRSDVATTLSKS